MGLFSRLEKNVKRDTEERPRQKKIEKILRQKRLADTSRPITREINPKARYVESPSARDLDAARRQARRQAVRGFAKGLSSTIGRGATWAVKQRRLQLPTTRRIKRGAMGSGLKYGKPGRPRGSFDPKYKAYRGVYEYRRRLSAELKRQRLEFLRKQQMTPEQQRLLSQEEARQRQIRMSPESRIIPDTNGEVKTKSFQDEIDEAANLVP